MKKRYTANEKSGKVVIIILMAVVVLLVAGATTYFVANIDKKYTVTEPNGGTIKLTITDMNKQLGVKTFYPGITINGTDVSGKTKEEVASLFAGDPSLDKPVLNLSLSVQGQTYPVDATNLNLTSNLSDVITEAYNYARTSEKTTLAESTIDRYENYLKLQATTKNYDTGYSADPTAISSEVHSVLDSLQTEVKDASATVFDKVALAFVIEPSSVGLKLDVDKAIADVQTALESKDYNKVIEVSAQVTEPKITTEDLTANLVLVSTTTTITKADSNRNSNINLVCQTIDGLVLQPGEFFNYNDFIGQRTAEKGYKEAGGIFDGALRQELGGGICQVSGTMYHSVMMADLKVDERHPHSWPSAYVDIGTDATVTWDGPNFQFTNNSEYPVAIHATYKDKTDGSGRGDLTVTLYGRPLETGVTIKIEGKVLSDTPPGPPEYVADPLSAVGTKNIELRSAHDEIKAVCYKVYYQDGVETSRVIADNSYYRPITAKYSVGALDPLTGIVYAVDPVTGIVILPVPTVDPGTPTPVPAA